MAAFCSGLVTLTSKIPVFQGETPLHTAAHKGLSKLTAALLEKGANPNAQTSAPIVSSLSDGDESLYKQTPLHLAIMAREKDVVNVFLDFKGRCELTGPWEMQL